MENTQQSPKTENQPLSQVNTQELTEPAQTPETFVPYDRYTSARLTCTPSEQKTIPGTGPQANPPSAPQYYYQIPLMYNFGTTENRILNDFKFEGCEMSSSYGIQSKPGPSGRMDHSIMSRFDMNDKEQTAFIDKMGEVHSGCAYILQQMKGAVKLYNFNAQMAEATGLKSPIYRARDEMTGEIVQGRAPSIFLKLFSRGKEPFVEQTLFTDLDGKPIPWALLKNVEMKFIPLLHIKRIYIGGGKASIQMEVVSAIVTSVRARNTATQQTTTLERLKQARPELIDMVSGQLAKLTIERQDQLLGMGEQKSEQDNDQDQDTNQPTFSGITPNKQQGMQQQQQQHNNGVKLPNIPSLDVGNKNMQDFTSAAPVRNTPVPGTPVRTSPAIGTPVANSPSTHLQYN